MTAIAPGVCSVTFRQLSAEEIIELAAAAAAAGDRVGRRRPPATGRHGAGRAVARPLRRRAAWPARPTARTTSPGKSAVDELAPTLETALALGATTVRVWAPGDPRPEHWEANAPVIDALRARVRRRRRARTHDRDGVPPGNAHRDGSIHPRGLGRRESAEPAHLLATGSRRYPSARADRARSRGPAPRAPARVLVGEPTALGCRWRPTRASGGGCSPRSRTNTTIARPTRTSSSSPTTRPRPSHAMRPRCAPGSRS